VRPLLLLLQLAMPLRILLPRRAAVPAVEHEKRKKRKDGANESEGKVGAKRTNGKRRNV